MGKLAKFFVVGTAALAAFGVKACALPALKKAPALATERALAQGGKAVAREALVNEATLLEWAFGGSGDSESEAESPRVRFSSTALLDSTGSGASTTAGVERFAPRVKVPTIDVAQLSVGECDAERSMRIARETQIREFERLRWQQQQLQQVQAEQWRLEQPLRSPVGYPEHP